MKRAKVVNVTRGTVLADEAGVADTFWKRFIGLMGKPPLPAGGGLVLRPGGAVHNLFVRQSLDVLHVDSEGRITNVVESLRPWRFGPLRVVSAATVELPPGTASATGTRPGDVIDIQLCR